MFCRTTLPRPRHVCGGAAARRQVATFAGIAEFRLGERRKISTHRPWKVPGGREIFLVLTFEAAGEAGLAAFRRRFLDGVWRWYLTFGGFAAIGKPLCEYGALVISALGRACSRPLHVRSSRR
ncbi:hypothetical protein GCM10022214_69220 [Actinomadura miaoliensis]|uniref:Uncharacterized protein n=1 Tax=Actinomadura miaoliensis TaxID=430685 RepID=A0ABP7WSV5_9ACTN